MRYRNSVTPHESRVAVIENGVLQGEAGQSRMHLLYRDVRMLAGAWMRRSGATCIRAAERPHTDVRAGVHRSRAVAPGTAGTDHRRLER